MPGAQANADQIQYWNEISGPRWVAAHERLDAMIEPLGQAAVDRAAPAAGERVLDVGCGCGASSLTLAQRVGARGSVLGVDVSEPMLARAEERARAAGLSHLRFLRGDAQTERFEPEADLVFSRFGVMFFDDPVAAFRNLRSALRPQGRLVFVCWQPLARNPWMALPMEVVDRFVPGRPRPEPGAPGPFALADPQQLRAILHDAGFHGIEIENRVAPQSLGASRQEALDLLLEGVGPVASALAEADRQVRQAVADALEELLSRHETASGVEFESAVWIAHARASADPPA